MPALGYAREVLPVEKHKHIAAYWGRVSERPSFHAVLREAAPHLAEFKKSLAAKR